MKRVGIGLLGYGTVGSGVGRLLRDSAEEIRLATGKDVYLRRVFARNPGVARAGLDLALVTSDFADIVNDPEIDVVVELIGGIEPARTFQLAALRAGKAVVTANKQLLSQHGAELLQTAEDAGTYLRFEASAVGAVPVVKVLRESLAGAEVSGVIGIVNGTTNYILSAMAQTGAEYEPTLRKAQDLGFAEADPTEDVGGKDAAAKMAILASIAFHSRVTLADVVYEGIESITDVDVAHGLTLSLVPKLLGVAKLIDGRANVRVYPSFIPAGHPLAGVSGAYNAVFLESSTFDKIMLFGPGAGGTPTASAVIGDIISIVNTAAGGFIRNCTCYKQLGFFPSDEVVSHFYLRLQVADEPGVLAQVAGLFGQEGVSIQSMQQTGQEKSAQLVLVLHPVREASFFRALARIVALNVVHGTPSVIRLEGDDAR
ncbi:MAG: homoserine dehydrogenase [Thermoleophilia bacterium]